MQEMLAGALDVDVVDLARLGGGDFAESYRATLADGRVVFAKTHRNPPPGFFTTEAFGLRWLRNADAVAVPEVLAVSDEPPLLVLEWIDEGGRPANDAAFGRSLAALHRAAAPAFGREDRRTTGSRGLPNDPCDSWVEFFATRRIEPLRRLAGDGRALSDAALVRLDVVIERLAELAGPPEPPARLHGDLWAGNRLIDTSGRSWLIDPAAFGGHREFDLSMMLLFGGFGPDAFAAYHDAFPLSDGWRDRVPLHQLAPLVVHAIKFAGSYPAAVDRALDTLV